MFADLAEAIIANLDVEGQTVIDGITPFGSEEGRTDTM